MRSMNKMASKIRPTNSKFRFSMNDHGSAWNICQESMPLTWIDELHLYLYKLYKLYRSCNESLLKLLEIRNYTSYTNYISGK